MFGYLAFVNTWIEPTRTAFRNSALLQKQTRSITERRDHHKVNPLSFRKSDN